MFGSKGALLAEVINPETFSTPVQQLIEELRATVDPPRRLSLVAQITRQAYEPRVRSLELLRTAEALAPELTDVARQIEARRRQNQARLMASGLGLLVVSIFRTDPANGFPPGVAAATHPSWHGAIHALGGLFVFVMLAAALAVFVRLFLAWKERWWAFYCLASAVLLLFIFFTGFTNAAFMARTLRLATFIGWMAASLVAIKLLSTDEQKTSPRRRSV